MAFLKPILGGAMIAAHPRRPQTPHHTPQDIPAAVRHVPGT
jgi:hypothetical protein